MRTGKVASACGEIVISHMRARLGPYRAEKEQVRMVSNPGPKIDRIAVSGFHVEHFVSERDASPIAVRCDCAVGRDHTYDEWHEAQDLPGMAPVLDSRLPTAEGKALLTLRELSVLDGLLDGCSTPQLAARFDVSVNTVKSHLGSIYRKLAVSNRAEAVKAALHHRLLTNKE